MQYDFSLLPGESKVIEVAGQYFTYKSGLGAIRVTPSSGGPVDLLPGQGMAAVKYDRLTIKDISGAGNSGFLLAGWGEWRDSRTTGTVEVLDGAKSRTLANMAFIGGGSCGSSAGQYALVQIWNPPSSTKRIVVESIAMLSLDASGLIQVRLSQTKLAINETVPAPYSKMTGGAQSAVAIMCHETKAAVTDPLLTGAAVTQNQTFNVKFTEPVLVMPGFGLTLNGTTSQGIVAYIEYIEEAF